MLGDDLAVGHVQLPHAAPGGGIVQDYAPDHGLGNAGLPGHLDDVLEGVVPALRADDAQCLVGGIRPGQERQWCTKGDGGAKGDFHGKWIRLPVLRCDRAGIFASDFAPGRAGDTTRPRPDLFNPERSLAQWAFRQDCFPC